MPFLSPNQQCRSTEGKNITFHGLAYLKLTLGGLPTLSLTTNSSWLPWGTCHASHQPSDASTPHHQLSTACNMTLADAILHFLCPPASALLIG